MCVCVCACDGVYVCVTVCVCVAMCVCARATHMFLFTDHSSSLYSFVYFSGLIYLFDTKPIRFRLFQQCHDLTRITCSRLYLVNIICIAFQFPCRMILLAGACNCIEGNIHVYDVMQDLACKHSDTRGKQHHLGSNSLFDPHSPKVLYRCFRPGVLFTLQWHLDNPPACHTETRL